MSNVVEIVCVGCEDPYVDLEKAVDALNRADGQRLFEFHLPWPEDRRRMRGFDLSTYDYKTTQEKLHGYYQQHVKKSVILIGVVDAPIEGNLFGGFRWHSEAFKSGLVTVHGFQRYTPSARAFLCFFLAKFAIQSLSAELKGHPPVTDRDPLKPCIFDDRKTRAHLIPILQKPDICDKCRTILDKVTADHQSYQALLDVVKTTQAATQVSTVIMKGGGVKGLALAGALSVLTDEKYRRFYAPATFVGASAGAIVATLLAAGLSSEDLRRELQNDFSKFLDGPCRFPLNLWSGFGLHTGDAIVVWLEKILKERFPKKRAAEDRVRLKEVREGKRRLVVYASSRLGTVTFDSEHEPRPADIPGIAITTAVRFSMSIPLFFTTKVHEDQEIFDGGLLNNYPVEIFRLQNPALEGEFMALYLSDGQKKPSRLLLGRIFSILLGRDEATDVRRHEPNTIVIDCSPVRTTDFSLGQNEKQLLWDRGRLAALERIIVRGWDDSADLVAECETLKQQLVATTASVLEERRNRGIKTWAFRAVSLAVLAVSIMGLRYLLGGWWPVLGVALALYLLCLLRSRRT